MAKIDRFNGNLKAFASDATGTERTIFGDTAQSDELDANITVDLLRGWGVIGVDSNPTKQHFNGLAFTLGQLISYLHQRGVPEWNAAQEYYEGSVVTTLAGIYRLNSGGVGSSDPDTDGGVNWELIPTQAKVDAKAAISGQAFSGNISAPNLSGTNTGDGVLAIGVGQTWQIVSRASGVTYTNTTGKPITAVVNIRDSGNYNPVTAFVGATRVIYNHDLTGGAGSSLTFIIPAGSTYKSDYSPNPLESWVELR